MRLSRKAQEEVVGFVAIVFLVAVVFVLLLGFSSKHTTIDTKTSQDIRFFLESVRVFTTNCSLNELYPLEFKDIITACYATKTCTSKVKACDALNGAASTILSKAFPTGKDAPLKGVRWNIVYNEPPSTEENALLKLLQGNCTSLSQRSSEDFFIVGAGQITLRMNLCY